MCLSLSSSPILREGWQFKHKRTYRLYTEENLPMRMQNRDDLNRELRAITPVPVQETARTNKAWDPGFSDIYSSVSGGRCR